MSRTRYSSDWKQIATAVKNASDWRCNKCGRACLRPGQKTLLLTLSQRKAHTLQVHHTEYEPRRQPRANASYLLTKTKKDYKMT